MSTRSHRTPTNHHLTCKHSKHIKIRNLTVIIYRLDLFLEILFGMQPFHMQRLIRWHWPKTREDRDADCQGEHVSNVPLCRASFLRWMTTTEQFLRTIAKHDLCLWRGVNKGIFVNIFFGKKKTLKLQEGCFWNGSLKGCWSNIGE